ncbi:hypothetical protein JF535_13175 [Microbulbifer salipaludis]|uniref:Minor tail protein n=1 Tax=Microbulbifer salipaludis TaxID=187980 RepID=A0ABS3E9C8_9GAMM|nr:hypothetical protein [Microbulbifer salipaludis]MBN8431803.1 hypothetical protein [Microbulbifer salipaludis]
MAEISYTATRELVSGSPEQIITDLVKCDRTHRSEGKDHTALSGFTESVFYRIENEWQITSLPFDPDQLPYWREFAASCANGEYFTLDISDIAGGASAPLTCQLKRNSFKESRYEHFWFQVSFTAVEA